MADLGNKQVSTVGDPDEVKQIYYNNEIYWLGEMPKIRSHLDKDTRLSEKFMNKDQILIISKTGNIKILDGNAFKETRKTKKIDTINIYIINMLQKLFICLDIFCKFCLTFGFFMLS